MIASALVAGYFGYGRFGCECDSYHVYGEFGFQFFGEVFGVWLWVLVLFVLRAVVTC